MSLTLARADAVDLAAAMLLDPTAEPVEPAEDDDDDSPDDEAAAEPPVPVGAAAET